MAKHVGTALAFSARHRDTTPENPHGSNRGWFWVSFATLTGVNLNGQFWCGCWCWLMAYAGGVRLPWRIVSVDWAEDHYRARGLVHHSLTKTRVMDLVVLFGHGVHIETVIAVWPGGVVTSGGNTGKGGRDNNGGGIFEQFRPWSDVHAVISVGRYYKPAPAKHRSKGNIARVLRLGDKGDDVRAVRRELGMKWRKPYPYGNKFTKPMVDKVYKKRKAVGLPGKPRIVDKAFATKLGFNWTGR